MRRLRPLARLARDAPRPRRLAGAAGGAETPPAQGAQPAGAPREAGSPEPVAGRGVAALAVGAGGLLGGGALLYALKVRRDAAQTAEAQRQAEAEERAGRLAKEAAALEAAQAAARRQAEQAEAERLAAIEARRAGLLAAVAAALPGARGPGATGEALATLRAAVRAAEADETVGEPERAPGSPLAEAAGCLARGERAGEALRALAAARGALREAVAGRSAAGCREALQAIEEASGVLASLEEQHVPEFEEMELESQARERLPEFEAAARLWAAVATGQPEECAGALAEAAAVGLGPCPAAALAEVVAGVPGSERARLAAETAQLLDLLDAPGEGSVEDFAASAAAAAAAEPSEQRLRERAAALARAACTAAALRAEALGGELGAAEDRLLELRSAQNQQAVTRFSASKAEELRGWLAALGSDRQRLREEAAADAAARVREEAGAAAAGLRERIGGWSSDSLGRSREALRERLASLQDPLARLGELHAAGLDPQSSTRSQGRLTGALRSLGACFAGGLPAARALEEVLAAPPDPFSQRVVAWLPAGTKERGGRAVPTAPELGHALRARLRGLVAAALEPPGGGLAAGLTGEALAWLYKFEALGQGKLDTEAQRNLAALARADALAERGEVRAALAELEASLTGGCRARALAWMEEARHALLLQQASRALLARAACAAL